MTRCSVGAQCAPSPTAAIRWREFILASRSIGHAPGMARVVVLVAAMASLVSGIARADDAAPVTLDQALAAADRAPAAQVGGSEVAAAEASVSAASAWPNPSLHLGTSRLTARLVASAALPLPVFGTVGAAQRVAAAGARVVRAEA